MFKVSIILYVLALFSFVAIYTINDGSNLRNSLFNPTRKPSDNTSGVASSNRKLLPLEFTPLPLGSIRPTQDSWLEHELKNSANGLAGHLRDFYVFVKDSTWLGGDKSRGEYSRLREGFPYWFNGLVGMAYSLPDDSTEAQRLKAQVHDAAQYVLDAQAKDGWLGPETLESGLRMLWGRFPLLLGLTSLVEANATGWEARVVPALWRFVNLGCDMLDNGGIGFVSQGSNDIVRSDQYFWGRVRVADLILTLQWLLERNSKPKREAMLWKCMNNGYEMSMKWEAWYNEATYIKEDLYRVPNRLTKPNYAFQHGVNVAQGLKAPAVIHRFTHNASLLQTSSDAVEWTFRYHGAASGTILADERINGLSPYSGSELCTAVEAIFSLAYIYHALGENKDADRTELVAFNALPSMLTSDHWAHQYVTQPNQPWSRPLSPSPFSNTNGHSQTFGLEPHYPCCTVNHPQGLPKFVSGSWVKVGHDGLAHVLLSPGTVKIDGVSIECRTQYPFSETLEYTIDAKDSFSFYVRVPAWASGHTIARNENEMLELGPPHAKTGLQKIDIAAGRTKISYTLDASVKVEQRANDTVAVYRGALLYALEVEHKAESGPPKSYRNHNPYSDDYAPPQVRDFTLTNTSAWNIAIDPSTITFERKDFSDLPDPIWETGAPPTYITARGCEIEWPLFKNVVPGAPLPLDERKCLKSPMTVRLVPLASAMLHMAELPIIDLN